MGNYIISQPAIKDLREIMGRSYSYLKPSLRGVILSNYIIFYRLLDGGIEIIRVVSGYRDLGSLFLEDK
jgi:toxin ParE1/3/4